MLVDMDDSPSKGTVLVADDSPDALSLLNECLVKDGYTVLIAMDGAQVLAIADRMSPDIIILDALMPNMDGFEACRQLKENVELRDVPVVFMTGLSDSEHVIRGLEVGGVDYINKPVKIDELLARIKVHLTNSKKAQSTQKALEEIGNLTFACNLHGDILWSTVGVRKLLSGACSTTCSTKGKDIAAEKTRIIDCLPKQLDRWLQRRPNKNSILAIEGIDQPLQVKYLGQTTPGEFLLKITEDDEVKVRQVLKESYSLTARESEVLFWLARGKANREIAVILSMSPRTVNKHLEQVYRKMGVENRTAAATICLKIMGSN